MKRVSLLRLRLPFASMLAPVAAGIVFSEIFHPSLVFVSLMATAALGGFAWTCARGYDSAREFSFYLFLATALAVIHLTQGPLSPAASFARWLGDRKMPVLAEGVVITEPSVFSPRSARFELRLDSLSIEEKPFALPITVQVRWHGAAPQYGDRLRIPGLLSNIPPPRNPGQFDAATWSQRQDIHQVIEVLQPGQRKCSEGTREIP